MCLVMCCKIPVLVVTAVPEFVLLEGGGVGSKICMSCPGRDPVCSGRRGERVGQREGN